MTTSRRHLYVGKSTSLARDAPDPASHGRAGSRVRRWRDGKNKVEKKRHKERNDASGTTTRPEPAPATTFGEPGPDVQPFPG